MSQPKNPEKLSVNNNLVLLAIYAFMGLCLLLGSVLVLTQPLPYADNPLLMKVTMGYVGFPLSLGIIVVSVRKMIMRKDAILIDERGITDHTSGLSSGFTAWEDIKEIFLLKLKDDSFLCALPADYDAWYARLSKSQQRLAQANVDAGFAPIRIQFKKITDKYHAQDGLAVCRRFHPEKIGRVRKPKY